MHKYPYIQIECVMLHLISCELCRRAKNEKRKTNRTLIGSLTILMVFIQSINRCVNFQIVYYVHHHASQFTIQLINKCNSIECKTNNGNSPNILKNNVCNFDNNTKYDVRAVPMPFTRNHKLEKMPEHRAASAQAIRTITATRESREQRFVAYCAI